MWVTWGRFSLRCSSSPEGLTCRVGITPTDCYPGDMGGPMAFLPARHQTAGKPCEMGKPKVVSGFILLNSWHSFIFVFL